MSAATRVAIHSPHELVARGLAALLARHPDRVEVVAVVVSVAPEGPAPAGARGGTPHGDADDHPDVVIFDLAALVDDLAGTGWAELQRLAHETSSAVLAVSREPRPDLVTRANQLGVDGFTALGVDAADLLAAVETADHGLHAEADDAPAPGLPSGTGGEEVTGAGDAGRGDARLGAEAGLTDREVDILRLVTQGLTNEEIARRTFLSINSVKTYIRSAYRRLGVTTRSQAVVWCLQHGFPARPGDPDGVPGQAGQPGQPGQQDQMVATDPESTR